MNRMLCLNPLPTLIAIAILVLPGNAAAQVADGTPPFGAFGGGPDVINLADLNVEYTVPLIYKPGRGLPLAVVLNYNSSIWYPSASTWQPLSSWGLTLGDQMGYVTYTERRTYCNGNTHIPLTIVSNWTYVDSTGTGHAFNFSTWAFTSTPCNTSSATGTSADGSGYTMSVTGAHVNYVISPDGAIIHPPLSPGSGGSIQDRNGNQISGGTTYTDTLGATALTVSGGPPPTAVTYAYTAPGANGNGTPAAVVVTYKAYPIQTNFGCSGVTEYGAKGAINNPLVDRITLADGSFYQFSYEQTYGSSTSYNGRLAKVTLPTGGAISYQYPNFTDSQGVTHNGGISCTTGATLQFTRTTPDGAWIYVNVPGTGGASTLTVTDLQGNQTIIQFEGIYETERQVYLGSSSSGTLLQTTTTCYDGNTTNCTSTLIRLPITQRTITSQLGSSGLQSQHVEFYDSYALVTEVDDYAFGNGAPGGSSARR